MSESEIVERLLTVWHAERDAWHAEHNDAATPKSHCVAVSTALALLLNRDGIDAEVVWYETTALLKHDDHERGRIVELSPRRDNGALFVPESSNNGQGVNAHVAVETEGSFHDPTFDQFGESQFGNWSVDLPPWSTEWGNVALRSEVKRSYPEVHHRWDFAIASKTGPLDVRVFYRELKRYRPHPLTHATPLVALLIERYDNVKVTP